MSAGERTETTYATGTVVTSDYLPWARVLSEFSSSTTLAPRSPSSSSTSPAPTSCATPTASNWSARRIVAIDPVTYRWMATIYDGFELSCALKPWLLRHLLRGAGAALYLDSDILVCDSLEHIAGRASARGLVLSPHRLEPPPADGLAPDEDAFLRLGQFNGGFLAVGPGGEAFLEWWGQRLVHDCVHHSDADPLRFVDQRWLDLTVNYFEVDVLRDRGTNVAYWNLDTRQLEHGPDGYTVDGEPLRFVHLSGFDPSDPGRLTKHPARVEAGHSPALSQICREYATALTDAGVQPKTGPSQTPTLASSIVLTPPIKDALRAAAATPAPAPAPAMTRPTRGQPRTCSPGCRRRSPRAAPLVT